MSNAPTSLRPAAAAKKRGALVGWVSTSSVAPAPPEDNTGAEASRVVAPAARMGNVDRASKADKWVMRLLAWKKNRDREREKGERETERERERMRERD